MVSDRSLIPATTLSHIPNNKKAIALSFHQKGDRSLTSKPNRRSHSHSNNKAIALRLQKGDRSLIPTTRRSLSVYRKAIALSFQQQGELTAILILKRFYAISAIPEFVKNGKTL
ncbi:hypothetical protein VB711_02155 [Cronbergia sp. UHCC 0137]|uniref:hypothetical protein n=1 Tax=Cronbergia sp. UHCC 0137 TaxID=3110239 RepID=UPI002B1EFC89|nr:hypothetical protein [Cronbergia sp. UHCC 0137]MEA5616646.1 hypothetical protein [Cronbergia sp. UHCC 0137]